MAYCPECGRVYKEAAAECADCGIALHSGSPPPAERSARRPRLVRVRTFRGPTAQLNADLAKNVLEQNGILAFVPGETSAEMLPGVDVLQLLVREEDGEQAAEILSALLDTPAQDGSQLASGE